MATATPSQECHQRGRRGTKEVRKRLIVTSFHLRKLDLFVWVPSSQELFLFLLQQIRKVARLLKVRRQGLPYESSAVIELTVVQGRNLVPKDLNGHVTFMIPSLLHDSVTTDVYILEDL